MYKFGLFLIFTALLAACGSPGNQRKNSQNGLLIAALVAQDHNKIVAANSRLKLNQQNQQIIDLYLLAVSDEPYQLLSHSQQLIKNFHQYNAAQQRILKPMLLWAYAHPIYRQETAKEVRLLQRETLMVAPSNINFAACEKSESGCSSTLRNQVANIIAPVEFTETLEQMANNDPCINLTQENVGGESGHQCLASRKGDLKINLISKPQFLFAQWEDLFDSHPLN